MVAPVPSGYSADVRMQLIVGNQQFSLHEVGDGMITLDHETILPGTEGEIVLHIDHHIRRWHATWHPSNDLRRTVEVKFLERPAPVK